MLEKISVRKPLTVLVGVILVVVLGIVSFTNTTMDLLPAMDLPFSAVVTMYPGATPEQIERDISIPLEARMSTISGISMVQSVSSEHVSFIIMQFTEGTNMDSASIEIREALDMINLPDGAMRPMTIRMNPEMLPIMTANVHMGGAGMDELSEFARNTVGPAIEGVPGVAVVNFSGLVQNQLHVVISQELIDEVNVNLGIAAVAMMNVAMAEITAQAEAMVTEQVMQFSESRLQILMGMGYSFVEAQEILEGELPEMTAMITTEVMQAMAEQLQGFEQYAQDVPPIGIPAAMLSVDTIAAVLGAQNFAMPAGMIVDGDDAMMVRVGDRFESFDEIENMLIFDPAQVGLVGAAPVRLSDVANVFMTDDSHLSFTRVNGNPAVMLSVQRQGEFPTADVSSDVRERMDALMEEYSRLGFSILMDQGEMIGVVVGSVIDSLLWGGLLAIVVLLLFLRDIRPTLIVAVSIPVSLMLAFALMYFSGISLNMISMGGLALTVGMLVDNSIAVIENIYRMRTSTGRSPARAALSGAKQMSGAIIAATLTTVAMFVPIVFTQGMTRQIFADLGLSIAFSLFASLLVALTVVPAASSVMLRKIKKEQEGNLFTKFVNAYEKALRFAMRFKWATLAFALAAFVLSLWAVGRQGTEMFPPMDLGQITATAELFDENATFEDATLAAERLSAQILAIEDVETVGVSIGGGGMMGMMAAGLGFGGFGGGEDVTIDVYIVLQEGRGISADELSAEITHIGEGLGLDVRVDAGDMGMEMMTGPAISLRVEGRELDDIRDTAIALAALVNTVPGAANITDVEEDMAAEMRVSVDKDAAMAHGLTVAQVFMAVNAALTAPERTIDINLQGRNYEIVISYEDFAVLVLDEIEDLMLETMGGYVRLGDIANVFEDVGFPTITRMNRNRFVTIQGEIADGFNVGLVNNDIADLLEDFVPIGDTRVIIGGEAEAIADAFADLALMLALGLLFMYLLMVAQFQSLLSPIIIMLTIPLAFTGGFAALLITGMPLSVVAMIGLILLAGVSINNGIVIISRINQMRWEGMAKKDAIIDAARKRIRPILMTAISTIFAMSVMALGMGEGTEMMQPMAIATIGGLAYATLMTLFIVPILYDMTHRNKDITKEDLDSDEKIAN